MNDLSCIDMDLLSLLASPLGGPCGTERRREMSRRAPIDSIRECRCIAITNLAFCI